jgi:flagellar protein FliS
MLYDGALRFLRQGLAGFEQEDPLEFNRTINNNVLRAQSILQELNNSLDLEQGGELARTLRQLYYYLDDRLSESNLRKTPEGIEEAVKRLTVLRDAWHQMLASQGGVMATVEFQDAGLSACV